MGGGDKQINKKDNFQPPFLKTFSPECSEKILEKNIFILVSEMQNFDNLFIER